MKNNSEFIERLDVLKKSRKLALEGKAINLDGTTYTMHDWAIEYLPVLDKAARILHEIETNPDIKLVKRNDEAIEHIQASLGAITWEDEGAARKWLGQALEILQTPSALDDLIGGV